MLSGVIRDIDDIVCAFEVNGEGREDVGMTIGRIGLWAMVRAWGAGG